ncbi:MAG: glycosyltransferase family 2 protein, partial [Pseudomonadota bacterium]
YAVRRVLARPPRLGCTDDFDISVGAVHAGYRLVFEPNARTTETTTERIGDEMRRRIRSSERGWRSLMQNAALMNPGLHGLYAWQLISHKLVRRMNPFLLFVFLVTNLALFASATFYTLTGLCQIAFYGVALAGLLRSEWRRHRIVGLASFFAFTHVALALGIMRCLFGRKSISWTPSRAEA